MSLPRLTGFAMACAFAVLSNGLLLANDDSSQGSSASSYSPKQPFFSFGGRAQLFGEYSNQSGSFMDKDPRYAYLEFAPTFSVYGIPISASVLYSTEDHAFHQHINSASISLNPSILQSYIVNRAQEKAEAYVTDHLSSAESAKDSLEKYKDVLQREAPERLRELEQSARMEEIRSMNPRDLASNKQLLQQAGLLSDYEKTMLLLPRVSLGTTYPQYTDLSLSGIAVKGVDADWNPSKLFVAFCTGTVLNPIPQYHPFDPFRSIDSTFSTQPVYSRAITAARLGYGSKSSSFVILSVVKAKDDPSSVPIVQNDSVPISSTPEESTILDLEWVSSLWDSRITTSVEGALSLYTSDVTSSEADLGLDSTDPVIAFFRRQVQIRLTSSYDWAAAATVRSTFPETGTKLSASLRRVGAGYHSLGLLNQRSDFVRMDLKADQSFFRHQLTIGGFYRDDHDNLADWKRATTSINAYGVNLGVSPRSYPFLRLSYSPYTQTNDASVDSLKLNTVTTMLSATLGYSYRIVGTSNNTTVSYMHNTIESINHLSDFAIHSYMLGHNTSFSFPLTLSLAVSHIEQQNLSSSINLPSLLSVWEGQIGCTYVIADIWNLSAGFSLADEQTDGTRNGYYASLNVPIGKIASFDIRAEKNVFKSTTLVGTQQYLRPYDETIVRASISRYW